MQRLSTRFNAVTNPLLSPRGRGESLSTKAGKPPSFRSATEAFAGRPREVQTLDSAQKLLSGSNWKLNHPVVSNTHSPDARHLLELVGQSASQRHVDRSRAHEAELLSRKVLSPELSAALNRAVDGLANTACHMTHFTRANVRPETHEDQRYIVLRSTSELQSHVSGGAHDAAKPLVQNNMIREDSEGWGGASHVYFALEPQGGAEQGFKTASHLGSTKFTVDMEHSYMQEALSDGVVVFVDPEMDHQDLMLESTDKVTVVNGAPALPLSQPTRGNHKQATLADLAGHYMRKQGSTGFDGAMAAEEMGVFHSPAELKSVVAQRVKAQVLFLESCMAKDIETLQDKNPAAAVWLERQRDALRALYQSDSPQALNELMNHIGLRPQVLVPTLLPIPHEADVLQVTELEPSSRWKPSGFDEL